MKLWDKGTEAEKAIDEFTVGKDRELDLFIAEFDVLGSIAHIIMLESIGLLTSSDLDILHTELISIHKSIKDGKFVLEDDVEDVHSQVELLLTRKLGDIGKKIHSGRSRNDQVLVDLKLFIRDEIKKTIICCDNLFNQLIKLSEEHKNTLLPGYTHLQVAMPSSFGLWFGAYAESLTDDLQLLLAAFKISNQNPLGSGAGYGSSFPLNRQMTTDLLGFDRMNYNVVYAQMGRGKTEKTVAFALSSIATTLSRMASDICLYMSQNFGFVSFPDSLTTGSSIMPHKKNPDVFELVRAKCNKIQVLPFEIGQITNNLTSGYFRDMQTIKEAFIPNFDELYSCINISTYMLENIIIKDNIIDDEKYKYMFSVENVNKMVLDGIPFRDAYIKIGKEINNNSYEPNKTITHTHEGSIGNLCNDEIVKKMQQIMSDFNFDKIDEAFSKLLNR